MCRYAPVVARANSVDRMNKLEMESEGVKVEPNAYLNSLSRASRQSPLFACQSRKSVVKPALHNSTWIHVSHR
ncbi:hypothetical protein CAEBREN_28666 [Caenorhabditis brenneri]|uniref:Uncharacterized protein n=1 Tax=Caenorhabditis brenneri TaxID=135651 RepID=G0PNN2_CAEBE|nr:hypothetical protein CAEBREN_28666 [Caenorhabditis brenneri]